MQKLSLIIYLTVFSFIISNTIWSQNIDTVYIEVDPTDIVGQIRKVNGGNLAPPLRSGRNPVEFRKAFSSLNIPVTRLHDAPLENAGTRLVDIPLIFGNMEADVNNRDNYYFKQTDDYIRNCIETGTAIYYRLGTSIEHTENKYFVNPPSNIHKWIDIASNIIRHYTQGLWDGFFYDIKYWEIWNEPDIGPKMWTGTIEEYNSFYVIVSTELKKRFPHLKFGGPGHSSGRESNVRNFLSYCAQNKAPLDFYSYHLYASDDKEILEHPAIIRRWLNECGYTQTEIHLNEWHYNPLGPPFWSLDHAEQADILQCAKGIEGAAFINTILIGWQDTPLDLGCYYTVTGTRWGLFDNNKPTKSFYGMKAFGEITKYSHRLKTTTRNLPSGSRTLAGADEYGNIALLTTLWKSGVRELVYQINYINDYSHVEIQLLDNTHDLTPVVEMENVSGKLKIQTTSESSVILIKLKYKTDNPNI